MISVRIGRGLNHWQVDHHIVSVARKRSEVVVDELLSLKACLDSVLLSKLWVGSSTCNGLRLL
jgi:hypothetical protein